MSPAATLAPASLEIAFDRDCADLLTRYVSAVGAYVVGYKTPILLVAIAGLVFACMQKRAAAVIALGIFAAIYLAMLYTTSLCSEYLQLSVGTICGGVERFLCHL